MLQACLQPGLDGLVRKTATDVASNSPAPGARTHWARLVSGWLADSLCPGAIATVATVTTGSGESILGSSFGFRSGAVRHRSLTQHSREPSLGDNKWLPSPSWRLVLVPFVEGRIEICRCVCLHGQSAASAGRALMR